MDSAGHAGEATTNGLQCGEGNGNGRVARATASALNALLKCLDLICKQYRKGSMKGYVSPLF